MAAAAAGKKESVTLSFFLEVNMSDVEEELSTMATLFWGGGRGEGRWRREQKKAIIDVQTWREVRGPAGAVVCEIRDLGIKWPQRHTLLFEEQVVVDMRVVCPQDVNKMLQKQARFVHWKRWAAKHECEELKEGVWLEQIKAMLRRKTNESWTDNHRNAMRKLVVEGCSVHKTLYDIGWSDEKKCRGCSKEEGTEKHRLYHCLSWREKSESRSQRDWGNGHRPTRRRKTGHGKEALRRIR